MVSCLTILTNYVVPCFETMVHLCKRLTNIIMIADLGHTNWQYTTLVNKQKPQAT